MDQSMQYELWLEQGAREELAFAFAFAA